MLTGRKEIKRFDGKTQVLQIKDQPVRTIEMNLRQEILSTIANPNFALILGVIGLLGLYLEFTNPGLVVPGVIGGISLLLALLGFSFLPVNIIGILLILLAVGLFIAEVKIQGFGILGVGGIIAMILGIIFLIDSPYPDMRINLVLAIAVAVPFAAIFIFLLQLAIKSFKSKVTTGEEGMVGTIGVTRTEVNRLDGRVFIGGEIWRATARNEIPPETRVRVVQARNLDLVVEPLDATKYRDRRETR
jgi:membrane-bound serine protease (ClpP class)